jgi:HEAT repeat protein
MVRLAEGTSIYELVRDENRYPLPEIMDVAELATLGDAKNLARLTELLDAKHPVIRYWAATGLVILKDKALRAKADLEERLQDDSPDVQIASAEALANLGETERAVAHLAELLTHDNQWVALRAANVLDILGEPAKSALPALEQAAKQNRHDYVKRAAEHTVEVLKGE